MTFNLNSINTTIDYLSNPSLTFVNLKLKNQYRILPGSVITLQIQTVKMPPCMAPLGGFRVFSGDSDYYKIEMAFYPKLTNNLPGNENTTNSKVLSEARIVSANGILQEGASYLFTVYTTGDMPAGAYFTMTVPDTVGIPPNPATTIRIECLQGCSTKQLTLTFDPLTRLATFYGVIP